MISPTLNSKHETWDIVDASKLKEYMVCPRMYFYRYILGWDLDRPNIHLVFGESWHKAMEVLVAHNNDPAYVQEAYEAFSSCYYKTFPDGMQSVVSSKKDPDIVPTALAEYCEQYGQDDYEVLFVEGAGSVPVSDTDRMHFRIDAVLRDRKDGKVVSLDHKTGSQLSTAWIDEWSLDLQMMLYYHVLNCLFGVGNVKGMVVNGVFFYAKERRFCRVSIIKDMAMMLAWLTDTNATLRELQTDMKRLYVCKAEDKTFNAFHRRPTSCTRYGTCKYHSFCCIWSNPLQHCQEVPIGFEQKWWNPADYEKVSKNIFKINEYKIPIEGGVDNGADK